MKSSDKGFTPLQMDNSPNIDYGNISSKISKRKPFLSYKKIVFPPLAGSAIGVIGDNSKVRFSVVRKVLYTFLHHKKGAGFTLLELMFGVSVLLVVIIAALSSLINCAFLSESNRNLATAANDAQYVLEQIKALDYDTRIATDFPSGYTLPTFTNLKNEVVAFVPSPTIGPSISKITVKVSWTERQKSRSFSLATYFAK